MNMRNCFRIFTRYLIQSVKFQNNRICLHVKISYLVLKTSRYITVIFESIRVLIHYEDHALMITCKKI